MVHIVGAPTFETCAWFDKCSPSINGVGRYWYENQKKLEFFRKFSKKIIIFVKKTGVITRQEAVSMIPPMFLDIQVNFY